MDLRAVCGGETPDADRAAAVFVGRADPALVRPEEISDNRASERDEKRETEPDADGRRRELFVDGCGASPDVPSLPIVSNSLTSTVTLLRMFDKNLYTRSQSRKQ